MTALLSLVRARDPRLVVLALFVVYVSLGFFWGLPGPDTWAPDSVSPRSVGLFAIAESYRPGHFHTYPPLHMAILTGLASPFTGLAMLRGGANAAALLDPLTMTGVELEARVVALAMALAITWNVMRLFQGLFGRRAAVLGGLALVTNATFVYYARVGTLDVPALFWASFALVEMDRVLEGESRERHALLFTVAAILTKDPIAAALLLPLVASLLVGPYLLRRASPLRRELVGAALGSAAAFLVVSGALVNRDGFRQRIAFLLGPASQTWAEVPKGWDGTRRLVASAWSHVPHFTSWPLAYAAVVGIVFAFGTTRGASRARAALPLLFALSFTLFFDLGARRSDDRFLLPQSVVLLPYAALPFEALWRLAANGMPKRFVTLAFGAALAPALLGVVSLDLTQHLDVRYAAERFLASLPAGTHIEVVGGVHFLPRISNRLDAVRPGIEPLADRQAIPGLQELVVTTDLDPRPRAPEYIVLSTELSSEEATSTATAPPAFGLMGYRDPASRAFLRGLRDGSYGYERVFAEGCTLPAPLECRSIHGGATGASLWIYERRD